MKRVAVLKLGGELIETKDRLKAMGKAVANAAKKHRLVVVHGGGREIDAALAQVGIPKRQVDGLRVTDEDTLNIVVSVLAGSINTRFVAAINAAGGKAVGLTGADAGVAPVKKAAPHKATNGETVDLGLVGMPVPAKSPAVVQALCKAGYVPVIACVGAAKDGQLFNVNADTLAGNIAARVKARRLIIAGATAGVLDKKNETIARLDKERIEKLVKSGTANAGMVAKLAACQAALKGGAKSVDIVDGRSPARLVKALNGEKTSATTRIVN
ncbi:MAG TPA: acetylglutamate kinase [Vicinamibacterales bacterium]|nr:acetylglutamate kinase [Vicinamibacterales bacterium]